MSRHANPRLITELGLLVLLSFIWGNSFTLMKVAVETISPLTLTAFRVFVAALILYAVMRYQSLAFPRHGKVWLFFTAQGFLQCALPYTLISWGEQEITSGLAGVLNSTPPVFVLLTAWLLGAGTSELTGRKIAGTVTGLAGVVLIMGVSVFRDAGHAAPLAQLAVLAASFCYALSPLIVSRFSGIPPLVTATGSMISAAAMMLPMSIVFDNPWMLSPDIEALFSACILAILCTALAMLIYFRLVITLGPLITASGGYLRAGFSVLSGMLFLNESFSLSTCAGMFLIILGIVVITAPIKK
ncbi:EamA family transporter [Klebsiella variicola]